MSNEKTRTCHHNNASTFLISSNFPSRRSKVLLEGSEQLDQSINPHFPLVLVADLRQCLSGVHQGQQSPLKVLPAQRLPAPGELDSQTADVRELLGQNVFTDDLKFLHAPHRGQFLIWDQHGVILALDLHTSQQDLR